MKRAGGLWRVGRGVMVMAGALEELMLLALLPLVAADCSLRAGAIGLMARCDALLVALERCPHYEQIAALLLSFLLWYVFNVVAVVVVKVRLQAASGCWRLFAPLLRGQ